MPGQAKLKATFIGLIAALLASPGASLGAAPGHSGVPADDGADEWIAPVLEEFLVTARVVDGSGRPVEGAVVITAVGGKGVSDADGLVRMRVRMDPAADRLRVSAVHTEGAETWTGSTIAEAAGGVVDAGEIPVVMRSGCEPGWERTFGTVSGVNGRVDSLAVFDDGTGPKLYAAGEFTEIGFAKLGRLAVWDGSHWKPIHPDWYNQSSSVRRLFVLDGGSGPALYVVGSFRIGAESYSIGRWDGQQWTSYPQTIATVNTLIYFDDGDGAKLYAGGAISSQCQLYRWEGSEWQILIASGHSGQISALAIYDSGAGPRLYVAGRFSELNGVQVSNIAAWDGTAFSPVGVGLDVPGSSTAPVVNALKTIDLGDGPKLFAGGRFTTAGGTDSNYIAAWNGAAWEPIGADLLATSSGSSITALATTTVGGRAALAAGGRFTSQSDPDMNGIAAWDGQSWTRLHTQSLQTRAMVEYNDGEHTRLIVGGIGQVLGESTIRNLAALHNGEWQQVGGDLPYRITAMTVFDDGNGPVPYAAFDADDPDIPMLHRWNGERWEGLSGPGSTNRTVWVLRVLNDGTGDRLYIGGSFPTPGAFANNILIWNGSEYAFVPGVNNQQVVAFEMFDDGSGPALYIGAVGGLLRADGTTVTSMQSVNMVYALKVFDDGSGPALYVGGSFGHMSHVPGTRLIAKWDGNAWHALGEGLLGSEVRAITVFDDGTGPAIFAAGQIVGATNDPSMPGIAKWNGTAWVPLGSGIFSIVQSLATFDDGTGNALYAGGYMTIAGGQQAIGVARWDGQEWSALLPQIQRSTASTSLFAGTTVRSMVEWNNNEGSSLLLAGRFYLPATGEQHAARWRACPPACLPDINGDGVVDADDFFEFLSLFAAGDLRADFNNDGVIDADDFFKFLALFAAGC
ncbi:MAG: hypothetical protein JJU33_07250 [Phycisphaerales bacterium]|nr:hypothetical protein [Phycisphaerales bacterium]